jgi:putative RNA 2'-phosphotransferase
MAAGDSRAVSVPLVDVSRVASHALRHEPWLYELELDADGWVPIDQLVDAIRAMGPKWSGVDRGVVTEMVETATKQRHEIDGDRIRALYGHSVPARIRKVPAAPPVRLFHGTSPAAWKRIRETGLAPMGRQYVHLSTDVETASAVGRRKDPAPLILLVDAARAHAAGVAFYEGNEMVWLADAVPAEFLQGRQDGTVDR